MEVPHEVKNVWVDILKRKKSLHWQELRLWDPLSASVFNELTKKEGIFHGLATDL